MADGLSRTVHGMMFDLDGTLAVGSSSGRGFTLLPAVADLFLQLRSRQLPYVVFTNGTAQPPEHYAEHLAAAGLELRAGQMMTPSSVATELFTTKAFRRVLLLGVDGVGKPLADAGIELVRPGEAGAEAVDAVYIGWHPEFGLTDIAAAADAQLRGVPVYVSSDAPFFFTSKGRTHGISAMIAGAVRSLTGRRPIVIGKPSTIAAVVVAARLGCAIEAMAVVGDDPRLEAAMANRCGALSIGVTTGLTDRAAWNAQPPARRAHHVIDRVDEILTRQLCAFGGPVERS